MTPAEARRPSVLAIGDRDVRHGGGLDRYLDDLRRHSTSDGCSFRSVVLTADPTATGVLSAGPATAPLPRRLLAISSTVRRAIRHQPPDLIDVHFAVNGWMPLRLTPARSLPLLVHFQGPWADESALQHDRRRGEVAVKRFVERRVYRRADLVVTLSAAFGRLLHDRYGVDERRIRTIAPGVDLETFVPGRADARARWGLGADTYVVGAVRRLDNRMGLDVLLDAWEAVLAARPEALLLLAGDGPVRPSLERRRSTSSRPESIRLLGRIDDDELVTLYRACDVTVVPSTALEGFGLVVLESLACGTPAIVTDVGGLPDAVLGLDDTMVVTAGDSVALARRLVAAADGAVPSADRCRAHAERFAWSSTVDAHDALYDELLCDAPLPLRVGFVDHVARLSGGEIALQRLIEALDGLDELDVEAVVALGEDGPLVDRLAASGVPVDVVGLDPTLRDVPRRGRRRWSSVLRHAGALVVHEYELVRWIRRRRPDVIHTNSLKSALTGGIAGRLTGRPVVWHLRDRLSTDDMSSGVRRLVLAAARVLPSEIIVNSAATAETVTGRPVTIVHDGVPEPAERRPRQDNDEPVFALVGRLTPWKGQELFLDAFEAAFPTGGARALVVGAPLFGEDDFELELRDRVARSTLADRVVFTGFVDDVGRIYDTVDVVVHSSIVPEPFGQVVLEAMAAGVAVIASGEGGPVELIRSGVDGLLFEPRDRDSLAQAMTELATDPVRRAALAAAGVRRAEEFGIARTAAAVAAVYRRLVPQPSVRPLATPHTTSRWRQLRTSRARRSGSQAL